MQSKLFAIVGAVVTAAAVSVLAASAQVQVAQIGPVQVNPNFVVPQFAVCAAGFTAEPTTVGDTTTYVCRSSAAICRDGWVPGGWVAENTLHPPVTFAYSCTPQQFVPR